MSQSVDRKMRFAGILENPYVSMLQRDILDYGRWQGLAKTLAGLDIKTVLDIGCGLGENSRVRPQGYVGIDNSWPRVRFGAERFKPARFVMADARRLPARTGSCDLAMLIDTSHHLNDGEFSRILTEMTRVSRQWVLVSDPVLFKGQGALSRFVYSLDRGAMFRTMDGMSTVLSNRPGLKMEAMDVFITRPGLYHHGVFLLRVSS